MSHGFKVGNICFTTRNCSRTNLGEGKSISIGPHTRVQVVEIDERGAHVVILNKAHKSFGVKFYLTNNELRNGVLRKETQ